MKPTLMLHDRDVKFTAMFTKTLQKHGITANPLPITSPNLNGRCERFIETIKLECLSKFIVFGKRHLDYLVTEFTSYYNRHRAHSSRDHLPPIREVPTEVASLSLDQIVITSHVGGLVKSFGRKAAGIAVPSLPEPPPTILVPLDADLPTVNGEIAFVA
ncbi:MAG: integrase core domain-containing protein [Planctomycetota bacterium]